MTDTKPLLEANHVSKYFGHVVALEDVSISLNAGEILCLLGDNGAGKSTLIKLLSGLWPPDRGSISLDGKPIGFRSPREALANGIATVYQDLAVFPLMSIARNFVYGSEPTVGRGPFRRLDSRQADRVARQQMEQIGISVRDTSQLVGTLSGGERQTVAIARAEHYGARVLILDEPTSALGVKEAAIVLRHVIGARNRGLGVILITHSVLHALPVGDRFTILSHGRVTGTFDRTNMNEKQLHELMGGGSEMEELQAELRQLALSR